MKSTNNLNKRQILYTAWGIICVGVLLCSAFIFPTYYCMYSDRNTLNKVNYMDITINTYETAYSSIAEKIHALAQSVTLGNPLYAVQINEPGIEMSKEELTKIANAEFAKLYKYDILPCQLKFKENRLVLRERYTFYETSETNELKGISCWKLVYDNSRRKVIFYLDEEYHKIYYLKIQQKKSTADAFAQEVFQHYSYTISQSTAADAKTGKTPFFDYWWNGILRYYDLEVYSENSTMWKEMDGGFQGIIEFENKYQIGIQKHYALNKDKTYIWEMGIPIEKMIQF